MAPSKSHPPLAYFHLSCAAIWAHIENLPPTPPHPHPTPLPRSLAPLCHAVELWNMLTRWKPPQSPCIMNEPNTIKTKTPGWSSLRGRMNKWFIKSGTKGIVGAGASYWRWQFVTSFSVLDWLENNKKCLQMTGSWKARSGNCQTCVTSGQHSKYLPCTMTRVFLEIFFSKHFSSWASLKNFWGTL